MRMALYSSEAEAPSWSNEMLIHMLLTCITKGIRTATPNVGVLPSVTYNMCFCGHRTHLSMLSPSGCG